METYILVLYLYLVGVTSAQQWNQWVKINRISFYVFFLSTKIFNFSFYYEKGVLNFKIKKYKKTNTMCVWAVKYLDQSHSSTIDKKSTNIFIQKKNFIQSCFHWYQYLKCQTCLNIYFVIFIIIFKKMLFILIFVTS